MGDKFQSVNTLRNSISPISIGKDKRFRGFQNGGQAVNFHDVKSPLQVDEIEYKNGFGFGYT